MFIKDVESVSVSYNNNYIIKSILENNEPYFIELSNDIINEFLRSKKTSYSEVILDYNMNFEVIITDIDLLHETTKESFEKLNYGRSESI